MFEVEDLEYLKYFLKMEIARSKMTISVSYCNYPLDLSKK